MTKLSKCVQSVSIRRLDIVIGCPKVGLPSSRYVPQTPTVVIKSSTFNDLNWFNFLNKYKSVLFLTIKKVNFLYLMVLSI